MGLSNTRYRIRINVNECNARYFNGLKIGNAKIQTWNLRVRVVLCRTFIRCLLHQPWAGFGEPPDVTRINSLI